MSPMALKPVSLSVPAILGKTFERKYIALGRIVTHWKEIVGNDFADITQPAKIHYTKPKAAGNGKKYTPGSATLDIAATSAVCATLVYQKDVILQRINNVFGDKWVTDIRFLHHELKRPSKTLRKTKSLTEDEKKYLSQVLEQVDDPDIKERLARLGEALLQEK